MRLDKYVENNVRAVKLDGAFNMWSVAINRIAELSSQVRCIHMFLVLTLTDTNGDVLTWT